VCVVLFALLQKPQGECGEREDNADVRHKPFPEMISEKQNIDADDCDYHERDTSP